MKKAAIGVDIGGTSIKIGLVDAGTVELIHRFVKKIVSSADLVQKFEATWTPEQLESHFEAGKIIEEVLAAEPLNPKALWYGGLVALELGRADLVRTRWTSLLALKPPDRVAEVVREQHCAGAHARGGGGCLAPGVPTAYDDHIVFLRILVRAHRFSPSLFHVEQADKTFFFPLFSYAKGSEDGA